MGNEKHFLSANHQQEGQLAFADKGPGVRLFRVGQQRLEQSKKFGNIVTGNKPDSPLIDLSVLVSEHVALSDLQSTLDGELELRFFRYSPCATLAVNSRTEPAASSTSPTYSSGRIQDVVRLQIVGRRYGFVRLFEQIDFAIQHDRQLVLLGDKVEPAPAGTGVEWHEYNDVAVRVAIVPHHGAKEGEFGHLPPLAEIGWLLIRKF